MLINREIIKRLLPRTHACTELAHLHVIHLAIVDTETLYPNMPAQACGIWPTQKTAQQHARTEGTRAHVAHKAAMYRETCPQTETATCPHRACAQACYIMSSMHNCNMPVQSARTCMLQRGVTHMVTKPQSLHDRTRLTRIPIANPDARQPST